MRFDQVRGLRVSMSWLHTWSGLVLGWLLFAIFVTGTLSFFRNEITFWMQPELHKARGGGELALGAAQKVLEREAADSTTWSITLPGARNPTLGVAWRVNPPAAPTIDANRFARGGASPGGEARGGEARRSESWRGESRGSQGGARGEAQRELRGNRRARAEGREGDENRARSASGNPHEVTPADDVRSRRARRSEAAEGRPDLAQPAEQGNAPPGRPQMKRLTLDPATGEILQGRETAGGNFLYRFHFELYGLDRVWGRWIIGIATLFMLVAIVSGVILHRNIFKDFFTFRPGKGKRSWLDAHNASSVLSLPFHLVITFSGLLLLGNLLLPSAVQSAFQGDSRAYMQSLRGSGNATAETPPSGERAPLTDLSALLTTAGQAWRGQPVGAITINHPGDRNAVVEVRAANMDNLTSGRRASQTLRFDGVSGRLLEASDAAVHPAAASPSLVQAIWNVQIMLHRGLFASPIPRWLLFLAGVGGSLMIASGLVMWRIAREKKATSFGHRLVEVMNVAGIAGLLVAIGAHLWSNRLIPADLAHRNDWEINVFFIVWGAAFLHALARKHKTAWIEQLVCAGASIALLPVLNACTGGLPLFDSVRQGQWLLAGFDLCALVSGGGLLFAARKVFLHAPSVRAGQGAPTVTPEPETDASLPETEADFSVFDKPRTEEST
jgi:uncharacterized iron-regulated membrane protein